MSNTIDQDRLDNFRLATTLQENQREYMNCKQENALLTDQVSELTKKLAEQQALSQKSYQAMELLYQAYAIINDGPDDSDMLMAIEKLNKGKQIRNELAKLPDSSCEELTKLLAEARKVPEGWQLVPCNHYRFSIQYWTGRHWAPEGSDEFNSAIESLLSASPKGE